MNNRKTYILRALLFAAAIGFLVLAVLLFIRERAVMGFLLAFAGLSTMALHQTDVDFEAGFSTRSFIRHVGAGRSQISTLGMLCSITSYFCLAAALICWIALR